MKKQNINQMVAPASRIAWACRRGMLELDVILMNFFQKSFFQLSEDERLGFISLLDCNDMDLYTWLVRGELDTASEHTMMIKMIREHARLTIPT